MNPRLSMLINLSLLWSGQVVTKGIAFLAFALLARRLAPAEYGAVEYVMGLATVAALTVEGGLAAVGVRRLAQGEASAKRLAALIPTAQSCLAAVVAPAMVFFTWAFGNDPHAGLLAGPVAISILLLPWRQEWLFQSYRRMGPIVIAQVLRVGLFALGVALLVRDGEDLLLVGVLEAGSVAAAAAYLLFLQHKSIAPVGVRLAAREMLDLGREGASIALSAALWALMQYAPLMVLANLAGMADAAYFGAAHRLGVSLVTFSAIYHFNLYPTLAERIVDDPAAMRRLMRRSVRATAWGGLGLALGLALVAEPLLELLFGPGFGAAAPAFQALIWVFPITLIAGHARWALIAARRPSAMMWAQALGSGAAVGLAFLLTPHLGAVGAGLSMSLASLSVWVATHLAAAFHRQAPAASPSLLPLATAAGLFIFVPQIGLGPWSSSALALSLFGLAAAVFDRALLREVADLWPGAASPPEEVV